MQQSAAVRFKAPGPRDEWELSWYRERLDDPRLLDAAVVADVRGVRYLLVPVGGRRRCGSVATSDREAARMLHGALDGWHGFPNPRVRWSCSYTACHVVAWGEEPPDLDHVVRGRMYGYSSTAIAEFVEDIGRC
ncbi:DUF6302 family protein [Streptomyces thermoviolaceus]|uniref:DUF6302 family protein n=1 Tax=Streptomyces thermoviolaceus TaxID=1952 RepID=UPI00203B9A00|nr:DUF6302 family protein [Streptomyces thermoviolaceus]MCM3264782.1 DUF6302 family protein [Streptomyces thermoviolaceus]